MRFFYFWKFPVSFPKFGTVPGFEPGGREFESLRARHTYQQVMLFYVSAIMHWVAVRVAIESENHIFLADLGFLDKAGQFRILRRKPESRTRCQMGEGCIRTPDPGPKKQKKKNGQ